VSDALGALWLKMLGVKIATDSDAEETVGSTSLQPSEVQETMVLVPVWPLQPPLSAALTGIGQLHGASVNLTASDAATSGFDRSSPLLTPRMVRPNALAAVL
jgi:hypothetical protein